jgi:hypothetical protein
LTPAFGLLTGADPKNPFRFGVDISDLPKSPHEGWRGMSGSSVVLRDWPDPSVIWVYGVVQLVPANFAGQLAITRLADGWRDGRLRDLLIAAGVPDREPEDPTLQVPERRQLSVLSEAAELLRMLRTTRTTFEAQARVRNELALRLIERLVLDPDAASFEELFTSSYQSMASAERRRFDFMRTLTMTVLHDCNQRALAIIERCGDLAVQVPDVDLLRTHLQIWLAKFDSVFTTSPDMCLLYVGLEEGVPFPEQVERELWDWLQQRPEGRKVSLGDKPPPLVQFGEGSRGFWKSGEEPGPPRPNEYETPGYGYLKARWKVRRLEELRAEIQALELSPRERRLTTPAREYSSLIGWGRYYGHGFNEEFSKHPQIVQDLVEEARIARERDEIMAGPEPLDAEWHPPNEAPEPEAPR